MSVKGGEKRKRKKKDKASNDENDAKIDVYPIISLVRTMLTRLVLA